ncbi:Peroxide stress-activated histidine kinase mak1 [Cyphellophora attinorum]|uniref:histidine kinase n=1 Tax=Cyphellophora attinorum TaxID=1664694 RepID=A0A0N1H385_9EURO|nr:Peroxide stress-activated histidine kinase mak1 [Phialophora attinorum]KPI34804.1 Peroxide stress-activated histidine kinase mak1 [Phialophora attinorum]
MRPAKSPRHAPPPPNRTSSHHKSSDKDGQQSTSETKSASKTPTAGTKETRVINDPIQPTNIRRPTQSPLMQDGAGLEAMRKKMGEALAQKQQRKASNSPEVHQPPTQPRGNSSEDLSGLTNVESSSDESVGTASATMSTDSARTIRAGFVNTPGSVRTPSYPFPRMQMKLNRLSSHRSAPSHKPFTLLSPTEGPLGNIQSMSSVLDTSDQGTPTGRTSAASQTGMQDPNYPMPDLYDTVLMLNAEPGLDMWWANVCDILSEAYGADRASLALPGDITDLENVPWGQKASFNVAGSDGSGLSQLDSLGTSEVDFRSANRQAEGQESSPTTATRPQLQSRHSIAGALPEFISRSSQRPSGPLRANSSMVATTEERPALNPPRLTRQMPTPRSQSTMDVQSAAPTDLASTEALPPRCFVFKSLQPLEQEPDPLLVRTGVSALFGKSRPVVLTRTYSEEPIGPEPQTPTIPGRPSTSGTRMKRLSSERADKPIQALKTVMTAQPDPTESPFFNQSSSVDEGAFQQDPPAYDYGASANQSLNAIGVEGAKSLVHIPLIQPTYARGAMASTLRFPIAILSFTTALNPYPLTLRQSLLYLLPHLASSFSLAQQYSNLQDRARGGVAQRHGAAFGLGGTFSDEGSELELVAELSGQVQEKDTFAAGLKAQGLLSNERALLRESPSSSLAGTPYDHKGFTPGMPPTPGRLFLAKRQKGGKAVTPGGRKPSEARGETGEDKKGAASRNTSGRAPQKESTIPISPRAGSQTSESDYGDVSGALDRLEHSLRRTSQQRTDSMTKEDPEKPLPELIASLMLNAVPVQLFLAKPNSGDLVWTNRKFDAFRSQGEGRVRDPWKNVHSEDRSGLTKLWGEAMKTGSQFTHYIRVKRFNSDSDFRWFVFRASTLLSNNGRLLYWIGSFLDVHEQYIKNLEASEKEASMARDAKIRAMADAIPQTLFEAVEGEGIVAVNQQWHTYSGQTLDDARGLGFARHVHREDLHKCGVLSPVDSLSLAKLSIESDSSSSSSSNKTISQGTAAKKGLFAPDQSVLANMLKQQSVSEEKDEEGRLSYLTEVRLRSKGGEYRWFLIRLVRVDQALLSSGRASWYGTCTDIETRKVLERELNQANQKVHQEMESKTKFFANMSHEIRTPLNGILGSMPWLTESALDLDQRRTVDTIQNSANNLRELVDNILDVTKVEAGKMTLLPKFFHVRTLCEEVVDTVSSRAIERGLELNYSLDANVPYNVKGDPFRVRQVLLNLLGNSVKFTEQGEVFMSCKLRDDPESVSGSAPSALLCFEVVDTGRGFDVGDFTRLFKQFGQFGHGSNHDAGSGLGLFLSKQLVEMHGGELTVTSQTGEGSTFSFYIRVGLPAPGEETSPQSTARTPRHRMSSSLSSRSQSATTMLLSKPADGSSSVIQTPGLSKYIASPPIQSPDVLPSSVASPAITATASAQPSLRSDSMSHVLSGSPASSLVPTPDSQRDKDATPHGGSTTTTTTDRQAMSEQALAMHSALRRTRSDNDSAALSLASQAHPATYSIVVICPAEHARVAIKQHIEHVVPLQIPTIVTTLADIGSFLQLFNGPAAPTFSHIILDIPASSDVMLFMRQLAALATTSPGIQIPALIIVTDHYQKRDIQEDFSLLTAPPINQKAYLIHKPVKPSVFAMIFDPAQLRNLSKESSRRGEVAQTSRDDFRNMVERVKDVVGNKGYRVLLVEDSEVNRKVIRKYLTKVGLGELCVEARDGVEAVEFVRGSGISAGDRSGVVAAEQAASSGGFDLIICDIQMPRKNGYEACMEIRALERGGSATPANVTATAAATGTAIAVPAASASSYHTNVTNNLPRRPPIPIMALTANAMPEERAAAAAAGFTDYLTKPVEYGVLGEMLVRLLEGRRRGEYVNYLG